MLTLWQFVVLRIGLGLGECRHFAPRVKAINQWFPAEKGRATLFFATLGAVAPAILPVILTALCSLFLLEKQFTVTLEPARAGAAPKRGTARREPGAGSGAGDRRRGREGLTVVDDPGSRRGPDPTEPWRRLYRATVGALAPGDLDALGFHRQWLADRQGSDAATAGEVGDGQAFLRQLAGWTTESGRRTAELAVLAARLVPRWGELAQELPKQMLGRGLPTDPLDFTSRLYDATSGPLSAMIRDLLTDDAFLQLLRRLLENWATAESLGARVSEGVFRRLQLATSSDTTRVATLVVGLDEKVDRLEDTIDDLDRGEDARARVDELALLREQVGRLENKLDRLLAAGDDGNGHAEDGGNGAGNRKGAGR